MANTEHCDRLLQGFEEWNAWRQGNPTVPDLSRADLSSANLRWAYLGGADLTEANLRGADISQASLSGSKLRQANLRGANLQNTTLVYTDFTGATLSGTNLSGALMIGTDLTRANLDGANLRKTQLARAILREANLDEAELGGAHLQSTLFSGVSLSRIIGLETCYHKGPSSIDHQTLRASPRLPEGFLRGCGFQDWEIESAKLYDPTLSPSEIAEIQTKVHDLRAGAPIGIEPIFISYAWKDDAFVDRLAKALEEKKVRYWRDKKDATAGRLDEVIEYGMSLHPTVLVVLSETSIARPWVEFEISTAVQRGYKLCPIAIDGAWTTWKHLSGDLRAQLRKYVVLDFSDQFDTRFQQLWTGIKRHYSEQ